MSGSTPPMNENAVGPLPPRRPALAGFVTVLGSGSALRSPSRVVQHAVHQAQHALQLGLPDGGVAVVPRVRVRKGGVQRQPDLAA